MKDVVIINGPCGVGKSTVAFECMNMLEGAGLPAAMVDAELAYFHPKPPKDPFGYAVAEAGLRALAGVYAAQGLARLLLSRVVENPGSTVPGKLVAALRAQTSELHGRLHVLSVALCADRRRYPKVRRVFPAP